ncbi:hypothetical protein H4R99_007552 [Coemansia sp. RSA 1722]|nr:hypothetical protein IWW45_005386 [Coemansia sp. RSA 485]KAJ2589178.1 hypothetical protein H4R99_007552 [Coemansia sp. RSA 1722]
MASPTLADNASSGFIRDLPPPPFQLCAAQLDPDLGLHNAVSRGDIGSIFYALIGGQPIDSISQGLQPIHVAATQEDPAVVDVLIQNGADINAQTQSSQCALPAKRHGTGKNICSKDTAQGLSKQHKRGLRSRGSFSFLKDSNGIGPISSPLGFTLGLNSMQAATDSLTDNDTSLCGRNEYCGATPLHFAIANDRVACVEVLIRNGARLDIADSYGNTPSTLAAACGDPDIAALVLGPRSLGLSGPKMPTHGFIKNQGLTISGTHAHVPLGLALQLPSPDPSVVCFAEEIADSPAFSGWNNMAAAHVTPLTPPPHGWGHGSRRKTAPAIRPAAAGPLNNATDISVPCSPPPPRRHTAGEAETKARQLSQNLLSPPPNQRVLTKFRNTSPIGIRALSVSQSLRSSVLHQKDSLDDMPKTAKQLSEGGGNSTVRQRPAKRADRNRLAQVCEKADSGATTRCGASETIAAGANNQQRGTTLYEIIPRIRSNDWPIGLGADVGSCRSSAVSRNSSANSRRERSYTDSVIEKAWRCYLEDYTDDDDYQDGSSEMIGSREQHNVGSSGEWNRPVPEPWMWKQAAMAIRNRRSQSLSANHQRHQHNH